MAFSFLHHYLGFYPAGRAGADGLPAQEIARRGKAAKMVITDPRHFFFNVFVSFNIESRHKGM